MTEEVTFTKSEIYTMTNTLYITYTELFKKGKISFHEYTIIENTIMRIQSMIEEKEIDWEKLEKELKE